MRTCAEGCLRRRFFPTRQKHFRRLSDRPRSTRLFLSRILPLEPRLVPEFADFAGAGGVFLLVFTDVAAGGLCGSADPAAVGGFGDATRLPTSPDCATLDRDRRRPPNLAATAETLPIFSHETPDNAPGPYTLGAMKIRGICDRPELAVVTPRSTLL